MSPGRAAAPAGEPGRASKQIGGQQIDNTTVPTASTMVPLVEALDRVVAQLAAQRVELARTAGAVDLIARSA